MVIGCAWAAVLAVEENSSNQSMTVTVDSAARKTWKTECPSNCSCYLGTLPVTAHNVHVRHDLSTVDCSNNRVTVPPLLLPDNTEVLLIPNNKYITKFTQLSPSSSLLYLDISNNSINNLDWNSFAYYPALEFLSLRANNLRSLPQSVFVLLTKLGSLDLSGNQLQNLSADIFKPLFHLKSLNLAHNNIMRVTAGWFENLRELRELDLSNNQLLVIEENDFHGLGNLSLLNLSNNKIRSIDHAAFAVIPKIIVLDLDHNQLQFVPKDSLQPLKMMKKLSLNENPIHKIHEGDFMMLNVNSVSISYMPDLEVVDKSAFQNLTYLTNVELHDNPKLLYVDPGAFHATPDLKSLYFHNNQLTALSPQIMQYVPSLEQIHLYHNPIRCDCNAFWIRELASEVQINSYSRPYFNHSDFIKCDLPLHLTGVSIADVDRDQFTKVCPPTTLPLFQENYTMDLGEELRLECHAYGVPEPKMSWLLPNDTEISNNIKGDKFEIVSKCVLIVRYLVPQDSGVYACKADNGIGYDISSTRLTVTDKPVRLVLFNIGHDYISLSWNGTQHSSLISDYQLHYREANGDQLMGNQGPANTNYRVIPLGPQYRSYTVTNLKSNTSYEFCMIYVYDTEYYKVDCEVFRTTSSLEYQSAIKKIVSEKIVAGVCTALGLIMALICMVTLVKKFLLRKDYKSPYSSEECESINIPLENVYHPLSTQMCSSKTSLLSVQTSKSQFDEY